MTQGYDKETNIKIRNLTVSFGEKTVIKNLSANFVKNKINTIIGASGSGKTTLLRAINRLNDEISSCKTTGNVNILLDEKWHSIMSPEVSTTNLRRKVGMVFQQPNPIPTTIAKNIALPLKLVTSMNATDIEQRMEEVLKQVHLWKEVKDRLKKSALILSGGQQQRLCLARTLSLKPEVILLDEPTNSLDFKATKNIEQLLFELKDEYTLIVVTHSLSQTRKISDEVNILSNGKIGKVLNKNQVGDNAIFNTLAEQHF